MDQKNPFETPNTFRLHRAEYLVGFALSIVLIIVHFGEIRWIPFIALFAYIDLIGYIPGAIAFRRSTDGRISKVYYVLYNSMHSLVTQGAVVGLWLWLAGPEWALLAIPFHVLGDRGLFGNFLKPFGLPFEPVADPLYDRITAQMRARTAGAGSRVPGPAVAEHTPGVAQEAGL
ncbi:hypothetical protein ACGFZZ_32355 [Streptomyces tendae]|uniref:hypothetical protein n=2 Tax=Streptomyces TaxID=1883 RepID=UPI00167236C5|nr:hypothetical protein [Streptomyces tendae]GHA83102.1 membrane protein [Streptomyces tendae]